MFRDVVDREHAFVYYKRIGLIQSQKLDFAKWLSHLCYLPSITRG